LPEVSWAGQKKKKLSNIFGWFWVCSQRYRSMITVVYFIFGFIASFGTIFLRKGRHIFLWKIPTVAINKNSLKNIKYKNNTARDDLGSVPPGNYLLTMR
jgi:hypothetical protein